MSVTDEPVDAYAGPELPDEGWDEAALAPPEVPRSRVSGIEAAFVIALLLLGAMGLLLYRSGQTMPAIILVAGPVLLACIAEPRVGIYTYCFWQAWDTAVPIGEIEGGLWITPAKLFAFVVLATGALRLWERPLPLSASKSVIRWLGFFCAAAAASMVFSYAKIASIRYSMQMLVQLGMLVVFIKLLSGNPGHLKRMLFWTVAGGVTAGLYISLFGMEQARYGRATLGERANPNSAALAVSTAFVCLPLLWVLTRNLLARLAMVASGFLMLLGITHTGSRAALGAIVAALVAGPVFSKTAGVAKRLLIVLVLGALMYGSVAAIIYSGVVEPKASERLARLFRLPGGETAEGPETSRFTVWGLGLRAYLDSKLIGTGIGGSSFANLQVSDVYLDVHSNLLGSLIEMGLPGLVTFLGVHVALWLAIRRVADKRLYVPLLMLFIVHVLNCMTHTTYATKWFWLPVTFMLVMCEMDVRLSGSGAPGAAGGTPESVPRHAAL